MINVFFRAVVFGLGIEAGREIYKSVKARVAGRRTSSTKAAERADQEPAARAQAEVPPPPQEPKDEETPGEEPRG